MYRVMALVEVRDAFFFGVKKGSLVAVSINPIKDEILCMVKLFPHSPCWSLDSMTWEEFFKFFEIKAFTEYCGKGTWPTGWSKTDEGKIYWR